MKKGGVVLLISLILIIGIISNVSAFSLEETWDSIKESTITAFASKKDSVSSDSSSSTSSGGSSSTSTSPSQRDKKGKKESGEPGAAISTDGSGDSSKVYISTTIGGSSSSKVKEGGGLIEGEEGSYRFGINNMEAISQLELERDNGGVRAKLSNGLKSDIKIMPNTASKIALSKLRSQDRTLELKEVGKDEDLRAVYYSETTKNAKVLGIFKTKYKDNLEIDSKTGKSIKSKGPWWKFLITEDLDEEEIEKLPLQLIKPLEDVVIQKNSMVSLNLDDYFFNAKEYSVFESENLILELEGALLTIIPSINWTGTTSFSLIAMRDNESLDATFNVIVTEENLSIQTTQYGAVVGEKVRWKKEIKLKNQENLNLNLPENSENITITELDIAGQVLNEESLLDGEVTITSEKEISNYEVEYYTPEPKMFEKDISENHKEIIIQGIEEVHYIDVLAFNYLKEGVREEQIKLYHLTENNKIEVEVDKYDLNENGLIDYIEWIVPQLSNQTYELEITDFAPGNFTITSPANNSIHNLDWIYVNLASSVNLNSALLNWINSSGATNVTMLNDSITHWYKNMTSLNDGDYDFSAWAENLSGSWIESNRISFSIDTTFPEINIIYPTNNSYNVNVSELNYTASDTNLQTCWYSLDNGENNVTITCGDNVTSLSSLEGSNTWIVYINDSAGNENSTSITFFKDTLNPQVSFGTGTAGDNDVVSQNYIYANVSVTEVNEDTITFRLYNSSGEVDSTSYTDSTREINWSGLTDGVYTYNVTVNDSLGNSNITSTRTLTLDTNAPVVSFSCDKTSVYAGEVITCSCSATSTIDANPSVSYTEKPATANTGTYDTICTATDDAGVSAQSSISYIVEQSGTGPSKTSNGAEVIGDEEEINETVIEEEPISLKEKNIFQRFWGWLSNLFKK